MLVLKVKVVNIQKIKLDFLRNYCADRGSALAWWLMPQTPDPEVGGLSPTRVKPCCVLEQGTFTPQKVLVIPMQEAVALSEHD